MSNYLKERPYNLTFNTNVPAPAFQDPIVSAYRKWHFHGFINASVAMSPSAPFQLQENLAVDYAYIYNTEVSIGSYAQIDRLFSIKYPKKSFSAGIHIEYDLNKHFSLQSGLNFSWFEVGEYFLGEINPYLDNPIATGANNFNLDRAPISSPFFFRYAQFELPVWLNFKLPASQRSLHPVLSGRLS